MLSVLGLALIAIVIVFAVIPSEPKRAADSDFNRAVARESVTPKTSQGSELEVPAEPASNHEQVAPDAVPATPKPAATPWTPDAGWIAGHKDKTLVELKVERETLWEELGVQTGPILMKRFEEGRKEWVADGDSYKMTDFDQSEISSLQKAPGEPWYRTTLPRSEYVEFYNMKAQVTWLDGRIRAKEIEKALAERGPR